MNIWTIALELFLKLVGFILDQVQASAETKAAFAAFLNTIEKNQMVPSKLKSSYEKQKEELKNGGGK